MAEIVGILTVSHRKKVIVLDQDESVLGLIYADDAAALFGNLPAESLYNISGMDDTARPFDSVQKVYESLSVVNLKLSYCVHCRVNDLSFKDTIDRLVLLAMYIPIVAGMGGNAASQVLRLCFEELP